MLNSDAQKKLTDLSADAQASLADLLQFDELSSEQWFMRQSIGGRACAWEVLTSDSQENDRQIKARIAASEKPVTDLVLAFIGMVEWRKKKQLMAYLQCFRTGYPQGILCLRHLTHDTTAGTFEPQGAFLIDGVLS